MWLLWGLISILLISLVNFIDEKLTENNPTKEISKNTHVEVGGLILISTLMSFVGAFVVYTALGFSPNTDQGGLLLAIASSVPYVAIFASYFYLLRIYPVYMVIPLFQLSSVWLLLVELFLGVSITIPQVIAVFVLLIGSYLLDVAKFEWKIPGKLLGIMIPVSMFWALGLYFVKEASLSIGASSVSFWQFLGIGVIGVIMVIFVKKYRTGLLLRVKHQGKTFLGLSAINESLSQGSYFFWKSCNRRSSRRNVRERIGRAARCVCTISLFLVF